MRITLPEYRKTFFSHAWRENVFSRTPCKKSLFWYANGCGKTFFWCTSYEKLYYESLFRKHTWRNDTKVWRTIFILTSRECYYCLFMKIAFSWMNRQSFRSNFKLFPKTSLILLWKISISQTTHPINFTFKNFEFFIGFQVLMEEKCKSLYGKIVWKVPGNFWKL